MLYNNKEIEILSGKSVFGKQIAEIKVQSTWEIKMVPFSELSDEKKQPTDTDIAFKAIVAKIKGEIASNRCSHPYGARLLTRCALRTSFEGTESTI